MILTMRSTFQSTRPMRGGTYKALEAASMERISIHPPHAGRDLNCFDLLFDLLPFQSTRPMRGGTCIRPRKLRPVSIFQSTRPMRGGTAIMHKIYPMHSCAIHNTTCSETTIRIPTSVFLLIIRSLSACSPVFRCEPMGSLLRASTSHGQIIRTSSGL